MMELTHFALLRTITGQEIYIGIRWTGACWADQLDIYYDAKTGCRVDSDFGVIDISTIQKYHDSENNTHVR
jgi:hypothetical protein